MAIDNNEWALVQKVLDDVRRDFPIVYNPFGFEAEIYNIIAKRVNEVADTIHQKYKKEFEAWEKDFERSCNGGK